MINVYKNTKRGTANQLELFTRKFGTSGYGATDLVEAQGDVGAFDGDWADRAGGTRGYAARPETVAAAVALLLAAAATVGLR